jgi:Uma2 family endonuclease
MSAIVEEVLDWPESAGQQRFYPPLNGLLPPPFTFAEIDQEWTSDELEYSDGEPMDSDWERMAIALLVESARYFFRARSDFYCAGDMFIYYGTSAKKRRCRGPDFFLVWGVDPTEIRTSWAQWNENGRLPNVIIELLSPRTRIADLTLKKDIYEEKFKTPDYFCYDPENRQLVGWRLKGTSYEAMEPTFGGRMWSEELGLWLGVWVGSYLGRNSAWLRFFTKEGFLVLTEAEAERQRAEADRQRAEAERQRAEAAEAELARLKAQLPPQS